MKKFTRKMKKIWQWLTQTRYVQFEFGTISDDKELAQDFEQAKLNIQISNFQKIICKLIKFEIDLELAKSGLLLTENEAKIRAYQAFCQAKRDGRINELNEIESEQQNVA